MAKGAVTLAPVGSCRWSLTLCGRSTMRYCSTPWGAAADVSK